MIRMLHLADLHLGVENYGHVDGATGLHTRLLDYLARLDEAIDGAIAAEVDFVLIAGDIYKNRTPNPTHQREFARRLRRIQAAGMPTLILTGNHDVSPAAGRAHSIEIFDTLEVEGVTVADRPSVHLVSTRNGEVQVVALPWITRHGLLTKDELRLVSLAEVDTLLLTRVESWVEHVLAELDPALPTVLTFHGTLFGATYGAERSIMLGHDLVLPRSVVAQSPVDYIALGHIHKHQQIGTLPPAVYPGSLERIDFGEEHEAKGYVLVDLAKGATEWRFVPVAARPFVTIEVDVRGSADPQARALYAVETRPVADAVVRVQVKALPEQAAQLREDELRRTLVARGAFIVATVAIEIERAARTRLGANAQELATGLMPRRALELYLQSKETPPERAAELLAAADKLIVKTRGSA
jgi:DNA repair protein SbcD/Mre11